MEDVSLAVSLSDHPADAADSSESVARDSASQTQTTPGRARRPRAERHRATDADIATGDRPRKRRSGGASRPRTDDRTDNQTDMHADSDSTDLSIDASAAAYIAGDEPASPPVADTVTPADLANNSEISAEVGESPASRDEAAAVESADAAEPVPGRRGRSGRAGETRRRSARIVGSKEEPEADAPPHSVDDSQSAMDTHAANSVGAEGMPSDFPTADADADAPVAAAIEPAMIAPAVEALLFSSDAPLPARKLAEFVGDAAAADIDQAVTILNERYATAQLTFRIEAVAGGYQMMTLPDYQPWLARLDKHRADQRLGDAALESLAIIAYRQPIIRADIEAIRGVACGEVLSRLRELGLVRITGRAEVVGRPLLYGTTRKFLDMFGLAGLEDLPPMDGQAFRRMQPPPEAQPPLETGDNSATQG